MKTENCRQLRFCREVSPCKGCTERFSACHDNCPKDARGEFGHKAWKANLEAIKERRKEYNELNRRKTWQR